MTAVGDRVLRVMAFTGEGVFNFVMDSQMAVPLALVGRHAPHIQRAMLVLTSRRHRANPRVAVRIQELRDALPGVQLRFHYRAVLDVPLQNWRWARHLRRALRDCGYVGGEPIIVHCRGEATAAAAAALRHRDPRIRILLDMRGAVSDEIAGRGLLAWRRRRLAARAFEQALDAADALNTVSQRLADHLRDTGALTRPIPSSVVGCCADTTRFRFDPAQRTTRRRELGFSDHFVVCYCGQMWHWQRPDAVAEAFAAIRAGIPGARMLIVSHQGEVLVSYLQRLGVPADCIIVRAATHDQVASYLMAADVGLLLRENSLTNRVASPVKFAEYLRCGLPVILTPYVGDFSALATAEGIGQIVDFPPRPDQIVHAAQAVRARLAAEGDAYRQWCSEVAAARFSWEAQLPQILRLYETLAGP